MIEINKSEFVFVQNGEFGDPEYQYLLDGVLSGLISFDGQWRGGLDHRYIYSSHAFKETAAKIDELNESLDKQREEFFGLF